MTPAPLPGGGDFPVDFVIASTAEPQQLVRLANQLVGKAFASGLFIFADADLKFDQPQAEVVFNRDKVRSQGVDLSQAGQDLSTMLGGDYVNRFSIQGRSYKVIPQVKRSERLTADQLAQIHVTGPDGQAGAALDLRHPRDLHRAAGAEALPAAERGAHPGRDPAARLAGPGPRRSWRPRPGRSCPRASPSTTRASRASSAPRASKFLGTFLLSAILIYLVLAAQFESFRDPFIILAGSVPLALSGALLFSFLGLTTLNIYSQVGLITLVGLVSKNGILIVEFANHLQETGQDKLHAVIEAAGTRLRPILMTTAATVVGHFPLVLASGPGAGARNSIGIMLVTGMIIGTLFTLFVVPSIYVLVARVRKVVREGGPAEEAAGELAQAAA